MSKIDRWITVVDVAQHLGVAAITIYRWLEKGQIPAHRVGRQWRFNQAEIDEWVKRGDAGDIDTEQIETDG